MAAELGQNICSGGWGHSVTGRVSMLQHRYTPNKFSCSSDYAIFQILLQKIFENPRFDKSIKIKSNWNGIG